MKGNVEGRWRPSLRNSVLRTPNCAASSLKPALKATFSCLAKQVGRRDLSEKEGFTSKKGVAGAP